MVHDFLPNWMIFLYWYNAGPLWESALTFQQGRTNFDVKNTCIALYQVIVQPQLIVKKWIQNVARISSQYWVSFWFQTKLLKCPIQPRTSSRMSVLSKPHFRNRSGYELSKLSMHFFKLEPEILICLPLVPKLIKNQSANIWKLFEFFDFVM